MFSRYTEHTLANAFYLDLLLSILYFSKGKFILSSCIFYIRNKLYVRPLLFCNTCCFNCTFLIGTVDKLTALWKFANIFYKSIAYVIICWVVVLMVAFHRGKNNFLRTKCHEVTLIFTCFCNEIIMPFLFTRRRCHSAGVSKR